MRISTIAVQNVCVLVSHLSIFELGWQIAAPFFYKPSIAAIIIFLVFLIYAIVIVSINECIISAFLQSPHS